MKLFKNCLQKHIQPVVVIDDGMIKHQHTVDPISPFLAINTGRSYIYTIYCLNPHGRQKNNTMRSTIFLVYVCIGTGQLYTYGIHLIRNLKKTFSLQKESEDTNANLYYTSLPHGPRWYSKNHKLHPNDGPISVFCSRFFKSYTVVQYVFVIVQENGMRERRFIWPTKRTLCVCDSG